MSVNDVYPLATQDGKAIPLDVLKPAAFVKLALTTTEAAFDLGEYRLASFLATADVILRFGTVTIGFITSGIPVPDALFLPQGTYIMALMPVGTFRAKTLGAATADVYVQCIEQWAGLGLDKQYTRK